MNLKSAMTLEMRIWLPTYAALCLALLIFCLMPHARKENVQAKAHKELIAMQQQTFNDIQAVISQDGITSSIEAVLDEATITLLLAEDRLFVPGTEQLLPTGLDILSKLENLFIIHKHQTINIKDYTDNKAPPPGARFRDNWELSALRSAQLLRHLLTHGIEPGRLTATGFGELEPLFPNTLEENRAKNRRIEFVLERRTVKE